MNIEKVRQKYLDFFTSGDRKHKQISAAPLVLENDPTTLFTSAGMQPLVPYLLGKKHSEGKRLVNSQPAIRTQDIEEVGDNRHTTFFEMLGNWSLGDYFKEEQLPWVWEFLTTRLKLPEEKLYVSVFKGDKDIPPDNESRRIWKQLGVADDHIFEYGLEKNWWSRAGSPDQMPEGEIGGPTSEVFFEFDQIKHDPKFGKKCHPNCDCGRFLEIGNSVFMVYQKTKAGLRELPRKNVDFGGGLERITAAKNNEPDIFKLPVFAGVIKQIENWSGKKYGQNAKDTAAMRVIADHIRAAVFLLVEGVEPSNKQQGYILRRLLRRSAVKAAQIGAKGSFSVMADIAESVLIAYDHQLNINRATQRNKVQEVIAQEMERFRKSLDKGLKIIKNSDKLTGKGAFNLYQTYGFPLELTLELAQERGQKIDLKQFKKAFENHKNKSRTASAGKFKGGLADVGEETTKLHTATHLLHAALRKVLGSHVQQKGSNITPERLRFDFTHPDKLTDEQITKVEDLVNEKIDKDLKVTVESMTFSEAKKSGALAFFADKYGKKVKVYSIGPANGPEAPFSREVCGGPHVDSLSQIGGHVKITKEKSASAGVRRIYAQII